MDTCLPRPAPCPPHIMPMIPLFVSGPMARGAGDLALALEVLAAPGRSEEPAPEPALLPAPQKRLSEYRVAAWFSDPAPASDLETEVMATLVKAVEALRAAGVRVDETHPDIDLGQDRQLFLDIYQNLMARNPPVPEHMARQEKQQAKWAAFFKLYDVLLAPVTRTTALLHDNQAPKETRSITVNGRKQPYWSNLTWNLMALVSGLPATAAPGGSEQVGPAGGNADNRAQVRRPDHHSLCPETGRGGRWIRPRRRITGNRLVQNPLHPKKAEPGPGRLPYGENQKTPRGVLPVGRGGAYPVTDII